MNVGSQFKPKYDWSELFNGEGRVYVRGVDFDCLPYGMMRNVYQAARRHGYRVSVSVGVDSVTVRVLGRRADG